MKRFDRPTPFRNLLSGTWLSTCTVVLGNEFIARMPDLPGALSTCVAEIASRAPCVLAPEVATTYFAGATCALAAGLAANSFSGIYHDAQRWHDLMSGKQHDNGLEL